MPNAGDVTLLDEGVALIFGTALLEITGTSTVFVLELENLQLRFLWLAQQT